jgi:glycosyltransferase involved in cell wall biosynthesis
MPSGQHRASIPKVPENANRPLWSVMIPTFNCARYLEQTLASVLAQDPGPSCMQIEVIDDHSTLDDPQEVVDAVGAGRVTFFRHPQNVGHIGNFEECLRRSRGHLVHLLHGDDYVRDGFYRKLAAPFASHSDLGAAFCRHIFMDEAGHWQSISQLDLPESGLYHNALERLASEQRIVTPSIVVKREVYEKLGGFDNRLICAEDWEMWVRIAARYPIWYEVEPLAVYRMHSDSNTGRHVRSGEDMRFTTAAIDLMRCYFPKQNADAWTRRARETYAGSALWTAHLLLKQKDIRGAWNVSREAFRCSPSLGTVLKAARLGMKAVVS